MLGVFFSLTAGVLVALQSVFNTRVSDKVGLIETAALVHGIGLLAALLAVLLIGDGNIKKIGEVNKLYLVGGVLGVVVVFSTMKGFSMLGASYAVTLMLISQLFIAMLIDKYGLFGSAKVDMDFTKILGLAVMVVGIVIFKWKG